MSDSTLLNINLDQPLVNNSDITIYLVFSTPRIAHQTLQGYQFSFKTTQDPSALIRDAYADVQVPENMYLKGKPKFDVQYNPSFIAQTASTAAPAAIAQYLPRIPYSSQYHTSNLFPGESFTVTGLYGDNLLLLYLQEILAAIAGVVVFILLMKFVLFSRIRKLFSKKNETFEHRSVFSFFRSLLVGLFSGVLFLTVYYSMSFIFNGSYYGVSIPLILLAVFLEFILSVLTLFSLPYYLFSHYSKREGMLSGIISIISAIVYLVIIAYMTPSITPLMEFVAGIARAA